MDSTVAMHQSVRFVLPGVKAKRTARYVRWGGMTKPPLAEPFQRLAHARRQAGYATASEAARAFGWNENTYRSHENGERGLRLDTAYKYAKAFRVEVDFILLGREGDLLIEGDYDSLIGYIDEEGMLHEFPADGVDGYEEQVALTSLQNIGAHWFAEIASDRPILGCRPGDLLAVFAGSLSEERYANFEGNLALVELEDGRQLLRRLRLGSDGKTIDIQIHTEMGALYVRAKQVILIYAIVQRGVWSKTTRKQRKIDLERYRIR